MEQVKGIIHAILTFFGAIANFVLTAMDFVEVGLRLFMRNAGLSNELQTFMLIIIVSASLVGAQRLLKGTLRTAISLVLVLVLAHVMSVLANHNTIVNFSNIPS